MSFLRLSSEFALPSRTIDALQFVSYAWEKKQKWKYLSPGACFGEAEEAKPYMHRDGGATAE